MLYTIQKERRCHMIDSNSYHCPDCLMLVKDCNNCKRAAREFLPRSMPAEGWYQISQGPGNSGKIYNSPPGEPPVPTGYTSEY